MGTRDQRGDGERASGAFRKQCRGRAELVEAGRNGWTFDAWDCADIAAALRRLSDLDKTERRDMGLASREILERKVPTAAFGTECSRFSTSEMRMSEDSGPWIVSQIGAREHYAIPRALQRRASRPALHRHLDPARVGLGRPSGTRRLRDRWHPELAGVPFFAPNARILAFEVGQRIRKRHGWETILARNSLYHRLVVRHLSTQFPPTEQGTRNRERGTVPLPPPCSATVARPWNCSGSRSRAAGARSSDKSTRPGGGTPRRGEHRRHAHLRTAWTPTPPVYWERWRKEVEHADRILVNSEWIAPVPAQGGSPGRENGSGAAGLREAGRWWASADGGGQSAVGGGQSAWAVGGWRMAAAVGGFVFGADQFAEGVARLLEAMRGLRDDPFP